MSDIIYEERYEDILPCYYVGMILNVLLSALVGIPFCAHEYLVGRVDILYVFTWVQRLYGAGAGVLFDAVSFHLQGL